MVTMLLVLLLLGQAVSCALLARVLAAAQRQVHPPATGVAPNGGEARQILKEWLYGGEEG